MHGLCELIERDAVAIWWYNRLQRPGVAAQAFEHPYLRWLCTRLARMGRSLWALDLTHDLGVPVIVALSARRKVPERILMGFGCHPDPGRALLRAATELVQSMPPRSNRDGAGDLPPEGGATAARWMQEASRAAMPYLVPHSNLPETSVAVDAADREEPPAHTLFGDLLSRLARGGLTAYYLDQTRPEAGLPVVRVIVPGLRHFWRHLGPGRLYNVPVEQGWLETACDEAALNPYPMFL